VRAVLNFAPARLRARPGVKVKTVDLTIQLESLSYFLARPQATQTRASRNVHSRKEVAARDESELVGARTIKGREHG